MQHRLRLWEMIGQPHSRADLDVRVHQVEVVVAQPEVHPEVLERRKMILPVRARLYSVPPATEGRKDIRIAPAIEEETLQFPKFDEFNAAFEHVAMPHVRKIALEPNRQR